MLSLVGVAMWGGAVGLQAVHGHRVDRCLRRVLDHHVGWTYDDLGDCERSERAWRWGARTMLIGAPVFSLLGGSAVGRGRARADAADGMPARRTTASSVAGGMLIAMGAMGVVATNTLFLVDDVQNRCAHRGYAECTRENHLILSGGNDLSVLMMSAGAWMVGHGSGYRRSARHYGLTLVPALGLGFAGVQISGEFGR
ncbi:MAG: hypothetical protein B7733_13735 [Myxococcales bacterium FL481]|nr:MAG: hypothetical protein B7733_13735 [Myxococcales bacterium FL481]